MRAMTMVMNVSDITVLRNRVAGGTVLHVFPVFPLEYCRL
jgi:hypothetical protein